jgi:hypothetical protein
MKKILLATVAVTTIASAKPTVQDSFARFVSLQGRGVETAAKIANQYRLDVKRVGPAHEKKKYMRSSAQTGSDSPLTPQGAVAAQSANLQRIPPGSAGKSAKQPSQNSNYIYYPQFARRFAKLLQ